MNITFSKAVSLAIMLLSVNIFAADNAFNQISNFTAESNAEQWFAWKVDLIEGNGVICCFHNISNKDNPDSSLCNLEHSNSSHIQITTNNLLTDDELIIYFKVADSKPVRVKAVSNSCKVNGADKKIIWLDNISAKSSIKFLVTNFKELETGTNQAGNIIQALAYHKEDAATKALIKLHQQTTDREYHEHIELMLSAMRGEQGLDFVIDQFDNQTKNDVRKELIFSISQSSSSRAQQKIHDIASNDKTPDMREQALFWLSQMGVENAGELIMQLITKEANTDVKLHGVFTLSQVENGAGLPYLEKLIRTSKNMKIQQQALFWLTESDEERALPILESILGN